jgi:cytochrome c biogenesis protein CcmG, thiol:disulfide interchange protein DsbE
MRGIPLALAALTAAVGLLVTPATYAADAGPKPIAAPDFALPALGGGNYRLSEYRGEVVAVVFWATWCGACRAALEAAERLQSTYGGSGLRVLGINLDERPEAARQFAAATGITFPVLVDGDNSVARAFHADRLPLAVLVDRSGAVRSLNGLTDSRAERRLVDDIRALLDE